MKKIALLCLLSLTGCETYVPAQDVYYTSATDAVYTQPTTVYTQPNATYVQPTAETAVYTTYQPQTIYVTEQQPATSVIYVEEPVYYHPAPILPAPRPYFPHHHFEPTPPPHFRPAPPRPPYHR